MNKYAKKLISAILSAGMIASTIGAAISSASAANLKMINNKYTDRNYVYGYYPVSGTARNPYYEEMTYYNNTLKAVNYFQNLGFNYYNTATMFSEPYSFNPVRTSTVYISRTNDNGQPGSNPVGGYSLVNSYKDMTGNANSAFGMIIIGPSDSSYMYDLGTAPDALAHEYVHLITQQLAGWDGTVRSSSIEAGAVVEAYSDILGELSESNPDWKIGTTLFKNNSDKKKCYRNLIDPKSTVKPTASNPNNKPTFFTDYNEFKRANLTSVTESNIYAASTILSHAAYLMSTTGMKKDWIAELWLKSITMFDNPSNPTISGCRKAVTAAANKYADDHNYSYTNRNELLKRIKWSFDAVKVY